jgi:hypothetical protein
MTTSMDHDGCRKHVLLLVAVLPHRTTTHNASLCYTLSAANCKLWAQCERNVVLLYVHGVAFWTVCALKSPGTSGDSSPTTTHVLSKPPRPPSPCLRPAPRMSNQAQQALQRNPPFEYKYNTMALECLLEPYRRPGVLSTPFGVSDNKFDHIGSSHFNKKYGIHTLLLPYAVKLHFHGLGSKCPTCLGPYLIQNGLLAYLRP